MVLSCSPFVAPDLRNDALAADAGHCVFVARLIVKDLLDRDVESNPSGFGCKLLGFVFGLESALRLLEWEAQGYFFHKEAGLPPGRDAIHLVFRFFEDPTVDLTELCGGVLRLEQERFAWHGQDCFRADIAVDDLISDDALDVIAEYLWATRHTVRDATLPQA